nr:WecB/TagA/CpsF family glycosyltransferase [uncultured Eisenbergiella sp.]
MTDKLQYSSILGTQINVTDMDKTVDYITMHLEELRGHYVCVSNVHTTVTAYRDPEYRRIQNRAAMNIPDGKPLSIVQRKAGFKEAERVPGPDLMPELFRISAKKGYRHYFYGSRPETLEALSSRLSKEYPGLNIVGMYSPPFRPLTEEEDGQVTDKINSSKPDFVWVGLGAPKQEKWMEAHDGKVCGVMLGVGAGFDFHAGTIKRAPKWMQEWCMEWLYRIGQDPRRLLGRYLDTNFSFVFYLCKERLRRKKGIDVLGNTMDKKTQERPFDSVRKKGKPYRIAMIGHKRIPSREGGVEIVVDELSTRMVKQGCEVDAYNRYGRHTAGKRFDQRRGKYYNGIRLITIPTPKSSALNAIVYSFLATVRALFGRYDMMHFHAEGPCTMILIPKLFGKHVVATIHGLDWQRSKWGNFASKVLKAGEKTAARHADAVIVLSKNMQDYFREVYQRETIFIPNGINRPELKPADLIKQAFGLEKDGYILFLARIVPEKGLHYLIEAFSQIKTDKKLVIAGGSSHSHEYMDQIRSMAARDSRIIMTDFVHGQCLEELYSNAYLFVLPSDVEGMALSLLEAMSYGNCCLVSDIEENTEVVEGHAVTFRKADTADLKEKLQHLLASPETVLKYKETSQDYICEKYNWDRVVEETLEIYRGCGRGEYEGINNQ